MRSKRNVGVGIKGGVAQVWLWVASRFVARSGCKEQQSLRSPTYLCLRPASQGLSRAFTISCPKANAQKAGCRKYVEKDLGGGDCYQCTERRELNGGIGWYREGEWEGSGITEELGLAPMHSVPCFARFYPPLCKVAMELFATDSLLLHSNLFITIKDSSSQGHSVFKVLMTSFYSGTAGQAEYVG